MTRVVVATFADAEAARHAAVALGRAELAAGPTRVRVDASTPARGARLELRVDAPDAPRAIALMRDLGARVEDRDGPRDLRDAGPLAGWGMAVADAVTAAMGGSTASDAQVPASGAAAPESGAAPGPSGCADDPPPHEAKRPRRRPRAAP